MRFLAGIWSRYKQIDPGISLGSNVWSLYGLLTGGSFLSSALLANSTWFWEKLGWAALPIGFMLSFLVLSLCIFLAGLGRYFWRFSSATTEAKNALPVRIGLVDEDRIYPPTITQGPAPLLFGLYVADISIGLKTVQTDHHGEIRIRLFNGTRRTFDIVSLTGWITFKAGNLISGDPQMKGELPPPTISSKTVKSAAPKTEWDLVIDQRFPSKEADKIPTILRSYPLHFDLALLDIQISEHEDPKKVERLILWAGVKYERGGSGTKSRI